MVTTYGEGLVVSEEPQLSGDSPLCVAQFVESMTMGGAEHLAVKIANNLAARGHTSHLIVQKYPDMLSERVHPDVRVHYLRFERESIVNPVKFIRSLRDGSRRLRQVVEREQIGLVQTHLPGANFLGLLLARQRVVSVFATVHNNQEFNYGDADNALLLRLRKWAYRRILLDTSGVIAVSEEVKKSLVADLGVNEVVAGKVTVVNNAVEIPRPIDKERALAIRQQWGCAPDDVFLLGAGRFCEQKNFGDLLEVAGHLRDLGCRFRLVIAGDGEQREALAERAQAAGLSGQVALPGNLTNLDEVMQAADLFLMTSLWEGLPLVLLEAMAAGVPAVAYAIPGVSEVLVNGGSGLSVPAGDTREFADAVSVLAGDADRRRIFGRAAKARINLVFSFDSYIQNLVAAYRGANTVSD